MLEKQLDGSRQANLTAQAVREVAEVWLWSGFCFVWLRECGSWLGFGLVPVWRLGCIAGSARRTTGEDRRECGLSSLTNGGLRFSADYGRHFVNDRFGEQRPCEVSEDLRRELWQGHAC